MIFLAIPSPPELPPAVPPSGFDLPAQFGVKGLQLGYLGIREAWGPGRQWLIGGIGGTGGSPLRSQAQPVSALPG